MTILKNLMHMAGYINEETDDEISFVHCTHSGYYLNFFVIKIGIQSDNGSG